MKLSDLTLTALKDIRRQPLRSALTIIALGISTVILVTIAAISMGGQRTIAEQFGSDDALKIVTVTANQSLGGASPFGSVQEVGGSTQKLDETSLARLKAIPGVATASPRAHVWEVASFAVEGSDKEFVAQAEGTYANSFLLAAGSSFQDSDKNVVVLGSAYIKELGYNTPDDALGKTITLTTQKGYRGVEAAIPPSDASKSQIDAFNQSAMPLKARVVGVTDKGPGQNSIYIPLEWAREIRTARYNESSGNEKRVDQLASDGFSSIVLQADTTDHIDNISNDVKTLGFGYVSSLSQVEKIQQSTAVIWIVLGAVALIAVIASSLGVVNTMLMAVSEQRYVIGVWRAVGARRKTIVRMFLVQAAALGLIGGIFGVGLAYVVTYYVNDYAKNLLQAQGLIVSDIATIPLVLSVAAIILTTLFAIAAGFYPAKRAARQDPSTVLSNGQ
jgi:ABC-type antimicrobial peptide transport system permease subunit